MIVAGTSLRLIHVLGSLELPVTEGRSRGTTAPRISGKAGGETENEGDIED